MDESVRGLEALLRLCFVREPEASDLYTMLGFGVSAPPFVSQALFSRVVDNDDLLPTIRKPVLITHGAVDAIVRRKSSSNTALGWRTRRLTSCRTQVMPRFGTMPHRSIGVSLHSPKRSRGAAGRTWRPAALPNG